MLLHFISALSVGSYCNLSASKAANISKACVLFSVFSKRNNTFFEKLKFSIA
jgi:hypothetical protein